MAHPVQAIHNISLCVSYAQIEDLIADVDAKLTDAIKQLRVKAMNGSNTSKLDGVDQAAALFGLFVRIRDLSERKSSLLAAINQGLLP
jgi:hypothetical protein